MFERYTDRARRVVVLAQEEARALGHNWVGTEHLLLGLMRESDGVGAQVLNRAGIEFSAVRHQIRELLRGQQEGMPAAEEPAGAGPAARLRPSRVWAIDRRRAERGFAASREAAGDIASRLAAMDARLTVIEQRLRDRTPGAEGR